MLYFMALALAVGLGVPIAAVGAAVSQGKAAASALEGMARQPEILPKLQIAMILSLVFMESLVIFSLLVFLMLSPKLPGSEAVLQAIKATAGK
jgi:F-type H+-transporting ATPase subunit c